MTLIPSNDLWPHKINERDETIDLIDAIFIISYNYYIGKKFLTSFIISPSICLHETLLWFLKGFILSFSASQILITIVGDIHKKIQFLQKCWVKSPILKAYRLSVLNFFYIKSCQYSMFYTNCSWKFS